MLKNINWLRKLMKNSGWMGLAQGAGIVDVLVRTIIVARLLSLDNFAAYAIALAFVGLISEFANLNIGAVVITYGAKFQEAGKTDQLKALFKIGYILTLVIALLAGVVIAALLAVSYDIFIEQPGLYGPIVVLGFAAVFNVLDSTNKSILRLVDRFKVSCIVDIALMVVNISFLFVFFQIVPSTPSNAIYGAAICLFQFGLVSTFVTWTVLASVAPRWWRAPLSLLANGRQSMSRMAIGNSLASFMQRLMRKGDVLLLAALAPAEVVGLYDIGKKLASLVLPVRNAISLAAFPQIARSISAGHHDKLRDLILQLMKFGFPAAILGLLVLWVLSDMIILLSFGDKYLAAGPIFIVLTIQSIFFLLFFWANALLLSTRHVRAQMAATAGGLLAMLLVAAILVPEWQAMGMAWASVVGTFAQFGFVGLVAWRILH